MAKVRERERERDVMVDKKMTESHKLATFVALTWKCSYITNPIV